MTDPESQSMATSEPLQEDFTKAMQGIVCDTDQRVRDEAPQAYKDLSMVMANQASLTEVVHRYHADTSSNYFCSGHARLGVWACSTKALLWFAVITDLHTCMSLQSVATYACTICDKTLRCCTGLVYACVLMCLHLQLGLS